MKYQRLSGQKRNKILRCFCLDVTALATAKIAGVNRNTVNAYFNDFREKILRHELADSGKETGVFELDESYFGAKRVRGKRGRGAAGKTPVFGLLKRGERGGANCRGLLERDAVADNSGGNPRRRR